MIPLARADTVLGPPHQSSYTKTDGRSRMEPEPEGYACCEGDHLAAPFAALAAGALLAMAALGAAFVLRRR